MKQHKLKPLTIFLIIVVVIFFVVMILSDSSTPTKKSMWIKCLKKAKGCSGGIPQVQLDLMSECNQIYKYTDEKSGFDELAKIVNSPC